MDILAYEVMQLLIVGVKKGLADMLAALVQVNDRVNLEAFEQFKQQAYENLNHKHKSMRG